MDDPDDPVIEPKDVPSFSFIENKVKEVDSTIIIFRVYYFFSTRLYRFQFIKKNKMCMIEVPRLMLENARDNGTASAHELGKLLDGAIEDPDRWNDFEG